MAEDVGGDVSITVGSATNYGLHHNTGSNVSKFRPSGKCVDWDRVKMSEVDLVTVTRCM